MRILVVHNAYQKFGGEDAVFRNEVALLKKAGIEVDIWCVSNDVVSGLWAKINTALGVIFSLSSYRAMRKRLRQNRPDVVHVHNFFPLLSPSIFYACRKEGVPCVMTVHNYRIICPTAILMHNNEICERSLISGPWWAVRERVYRDSWLGALMLATMIAVHHRLGTWRSVISRLIVLTEFSRQKFMAWGVPADRLIIKPNFVPKDARVTELATQHLPHEFVLYVGRLSSEKGMTVLAAAWKNLDIPLVVVGEGPEQDCLLGNRNIHVLGRKSPDEVLGLMRQSRFIVMPSLWYEGFPMTLVEAMAMRRAAVVSGLGAMQEIVIDGVTGLHFPPGDSSALAAVVSTLFADDKRACELGERAYEEFQEKYTEEVSLHALVSIYESVIRDKASG